MKRPTSQEPCAPALSTLELADLKRIQGGNVVNAGDISLGVGPRPIPVGPGPTVNPPPPVSVPGGVSMPQRRG